MWDLKIVDVSLYSNLGLDFISHWNLVLNFKFYFNLILNFKSYSNLTLDFKFYSNLVLNFKSYSNLILDGISSPWLYICSSSSHLLIQFLLLFFSCSSSWIGAVRWGRFSNIWAYHFLLFSLLLPVTPYFSNIKWY